jgi:hypothetical protein
MIERPKDFMVSTPILLKIPCSCCWPEARGDPKASFAEKERFLFGEARAFILGLVSAENPRT